MTTINDILHDIEHQPTWDPLRKVYTSVAKQGGQISSGSSMQTPRWKERKNMRRILENTWVCGRCRRVWQGTGHHMIAKIHERENSGHQVYRLGSLDKITMLMLIGSFLLENKGVVEI